MTHAPLTRQSHWGKIVRLALGYGLKLPRSASAPVFAAGVRMLDGVDGAGEAAKNSCTDVRRRDRAAAAAKAQRRPNPATTEVAAPMASAPATRLGVDWRADATDDRTHHAPVLAVAVAQKHKRRRSTRVAVAAGVQRRRQAFPPLLPVEVEPGVAARICCEATFQFDSDDAIDDATAQRRHGEADKSQ